MNSRSELDAEVEAHLRAIWKGGSVIQPTWTAEHIQARAKRFEAHARKLAFGDAISFLLVPAIVVAALLAADVRNLMQQPHGRIGITGAVLLVLSSVVGFLVLRRHSYATVTSNVNDLLGSHLERLSRLRDWYASTPWGAGFYLPGVVLVLISAGMNPAGHGWEMPVIWAGVAAFIYVLACIQTRLKAQALQREIDALQVLRHTP